MRIGFWFVGSGCAAVGLAFTAWGQGGAAPGLKTAVNPSEDRPATVSEARSRARLLHDALHGTLQTVHRDYYRENEGLKIPAATLKGVFEDLSKSRGVELRWLAVDARAMNVDHEPESDFDKEAVKAIHGGKEFHEAVDDGRYRYAGAIVLHAECLKCHLPARSSNKARSAALVITMPIPSPSR